MLHNILFTECPKCKDEAIEKDERMGFISSETRGNIGVLLPVSRGSVVLHNWICNRCDYKLLDLK